MANERALYNANDGLTGRDGGPYLDLEEDRLAEERRARVEGRKPDLDNPPASAGTVLVTAGQLLANAGVNNVPSQDGSVSLGEELAVKGLADGKESGLTARGTVPETAYTPLDAPTDLSMRSALMTDGEAAEGESNAEQTKQNKEQVKATKKAASAPAKKTTAKKAAPTSSTDKSEDPRGTRPTAK